MTVEDWAGRRKRSIQYPPARLSQSSRPSSFEMSSSWRSLRRTAGRPPVTLECGNGGLQGEHPQKRSRNDPSRCRPAAWDCAILPLLTTPSPGAVTELLRAWGDGDDGALEQLTPLVEAELRRLARGYMAPRAARPHLADHGVGE